MSTDITERKLENTVQRLCPKCNQPPKQVGRGDGCMDSYCPYDYSPNRIVHYSDSAKRGCPTCDGVDPRSCLRCHGKTRLCDWYRKQDGWTCGL